MSPQHDDQRSNDLVWKDLNSSVKSGAPIGANESAPEIRERSRLYHQSEEVSLKDYFAVVLKRRWTILTLFLLGIGFSAFYVYTATPMYRSEATIEVGEQGQESIKTLGEELQKGLDLGDRGVQETEAEIFKSRSVAQALVERMHLDTSARFNRTDFKSPLNRFIDWTRSLIADPDQDRKKLAQERVKADTTDRLLERVTVKKQGKTRLLKVGMEGDDPEFTKKMLENYIDIYFDQNLRKRQKAVERANAWIKDELDQVEQKLVKSLTALISFISSHGLVSLDDNANHIITFFNKAAERLVKSNEQLTQLEATTRNLRSGSVAVLPPGVQPLDLRRLQEKLSLLESEYTEKIQIYSEDYPRVQMLKTSIETLRKKVDEMEKNAVTDVVEAAKQQEALDHRAFEHAKKEAMNVNALGVDYAVLKKEVETNEQLYKVLLQKSKEMALNAQLIGNNLNLIDPPEKPLDPIRPKKFLIILLGAFSGLTAGVVVAFFLDHMDDKVHTAEDIERELNLPSLGVVPNVKKLKLDVSVNGNRGVYEFLPYDAPRSLVADSVGNITTSMMLLSPAGNNSYLFTSAVPGEGKTFLSVACAAAIASDEKRVLIVDADLRQPSLGEVFGIRDESLGLTNLIKSRDVRLSDVIHRTRVPGLFFLPAGQSPSNPVAYLRSERTKKILDYLKGHFNFLIVDTPPVVGFPDVLLLKDYCESVILVTREGLVPIGLLQHAAKLVNTLPGNTLGVILNMADVRASHYGSYRYSNHYKYYGYDKYYSRNGKGKKTAKSKDGEAFS